MQTTSTQVAYESGRGPLRAFAFALGAFLFLVASSWILDRQSLRLAWDAYIFSPGFFAGALPILVLYGFLLSVTNRTWLPVLLAMALLVGLFVANTKKVEFLHSTIVSTDYYFLKSLDASSLELLRNYTNVPLVLGGLLAVIVVVWLLLCHERPVFRGQYILRLTALISSIVLGWVLVSGGRVVERVYDPTALRISYSPLISELHAGLISALIYENAANRRAMNAPADPDAVARLLADERARFSPVAVSSAPANPTPPDIVVIQSESFFDPSVIQGISADNLLPNLHRAQKESGAWSMSVPTFGGGTLRTEFEVLTGIPLEAYPDLQFPYLQISQPRIESIVTALDGAGYSTIAIHPNSGEFWNRRVAYRSLGFQKFLTITDFPASSYRDGLYISDHSLTSQVMSSLDATDGPAFIFAVSIETHGPYRHHFVKDAAERDALFAPAGMSEKAADEFRTYSYHIRHADSELGRLWAHLKLRKRPFILAFYGDHLPGLEFVYQKSTFQNGLAAYQQHVPLTLISSSESSNSGSGKHIYSWMLADEILRRAGVHEPAYFRLVGNAGRMLGGGAAMEQTQEGLRSAARMRLTGNFDAFYRSHAGVD